MAEQKLDGFEERTVQTRNARTIILASLSVFILLDIVLAGLLIAGITSKPAAEKPKYVNKTFLMQVEVLNACGKKGATDGIVDFLRSHEVDVVQARNYISFDLDESLVVCRNEKKEKAIAIASLLGLPENRVVQLVNKDLFLDATVLLGKDYFKLGSTEKGKH